MTLSERLEARRHRFCEDGPQQDGRCIVHAGGVFDGNGNQCDRAHRTVEPDRPAWVRRLDKNAKILVG